MDNIKELPILVERAITWGLCGVLVIDMVAHSDELEKQRMNTPDKIHIAEKYYGEALQVVESLKHQEPDFDLRLPATYDPVTKKFSISEAFEEIRLR